MSAKSSDEATVDLDQLLKLRLAVGRFGEMDLARWWNTNGMLGRRGAVALERGFPSTHRFAQARVVFAVARSRCQEIFDPPDSMTLWSLPAEIEDQFDACWHAWLSRSDEWEPFFDTLANLKGDDLLEVLSTLELIERSQREAVGKLRRSAENRAVQLQSSGAADDEVITMLAAAFARGEQSTPAIPYARLST